MLPNGFLSLGLPSLSFLSTHEADIVRGAPKPIQAKKDGLPLSLEGQLGTKARTRGKEAQNWWSLKLLSA